MRLYKAGVFGRFMVILHLGGMQYGRKEKQTVSAAKRKSPAGSGAGCVIHRVHRPSLLYAAHC